MIYLSKYLPQLVLPLGFSLLLLLVGIIRRRRALQVAGLAVLLVSSNPIVGRFLIRATEGWAERIPAAEASTADAIVVLSAGRRMAPGRAGISEWGEANRFFGGLELFKAGKAPLLIFTGGWVPWDPSAQTEGMLLAEYAKSFGVPAQSIAVTGRVSNTADEAREVASLLAARAGGHTVLLVTSAFHMPRARQLFSQKGITVAPFPVGFAVPAGGGLPGGFLMPSVGAVGLTQASIREAYGRVFYWLRGFVS